MPTRELEGEYVLFYNREIAADGYPWELRPVDNMNEDIHARDVKAESVSLNASYDPKRSGYVKAYVVIRGKITIEI